MVARCRQNDRPVLPMTAAEADFEFRRRKTWLRHQISALAARTGVRIYDLRYGELDLAESAGPRLELPAPIRLVRLDHSIDDATLATVVPRMRDLWFERFGQGSHCVVAYVDGTYAGSAWYSDRQVLLEEKKLVDLPPACLYAYGGYVEPPFRDRGLFKGLTQEIVTVANERGCRFVGHLCDAQNHGSINARLALGFRYQCARLLVLPGWRVISLGRAARVGHTQRLGC